MRTINFCSLFTVSTLVALNLFVPNAKAQDFLTTGLVAYYPFNGNANDESGNGNGAIAYGALLATNRFGVASDSYSFANGTYIKTTNSIGFPISTEDFTVSVWLSVSVMPPNAAMIFVNQAIDQFQLGFQPLSGTTANLMFYTGGDHGAPADCLTDTINWGLNRWYQLVVLRSQNMVTIYRDGVVIGQNQTTFGNNASPADSNLDFGFRSSPGGYVCCPFFGQLDDIRIYNRALSTNEVAQLYAIESVPHCIPHRATATARLDNGFVVDATITNGGCGYTNNPLVLIQGGGGSGATATAVVSNGVVVEIKITAAGVGYTSTPSIYIYSPSGLQVGLMKAVKPTFSDLLIGTTCQLQVSTDLNSWTNQGTPFTATNSTMIYPQYWDVANWSQLFFRLQVAP